jgi:hypothetical protein
MTQDEIIVMVRQAEDEVIANQNLDWKIEFAKLVAAKEREAAEERVVDLFTDMETPYLPDIIKAIRARGEA